MTPSPRIKAGSL